MAPSGWRPTESAVAPAIEARAVRWQAPADGDTNTALHGLDLHIGGGELVVVSGAGARTLLRLLAGVLRSQAGVLVVDGVDLARAGETALAAHRRATGTLIGDAEANLVPGLVAALRRAGAEDVAVVVGGIVPHEDEAALLAAGVAEVFHPGRPLADIVATIDRLSAGRRTAAARHGGASHG